VARPALKRSGFSGDGVRIIRETRHHMNRSSNIAENGIEAGVTRFSILLVCIPNLAQLFRPAPEPSKKPRGVLSPFKALRRRGGVILRRRRLLETQARRNLGSGGQEPECLVAHHLREPLPR
jgi:hypothetical protein